MSGLTPGVRNGGSVRQSPASAPATNAATIMVSTAGIESYVELAANTVLARSSSGVAAAKTVTDFGFSLLDDPDAATARTTLGITSASPGGSSGQVQYNNAGAFGGFAGLTVSASSPNVVVTAQGAAHVPLCVQLVGSQSANAIEVKTSGASTVFSVSPAGVVTTSASAALSGMTVGGFSIRSSTSTALYLIGSSAGVEIGNYATALATVKPNSANGTSELQYYLTSSLTLKQASSGVVEFNNGTTGTLVTATAILRPAAYTFATVPSASANARSTISITDRSNRQAYSDGTNWRFVADDVIIS